MSVRRPSKESVTKMLLDILGKVANSLILPVIVISLWASIQKRTAVPGSRVRYVASTLLVGSEIALLILSFVQGVADFSQGDYPGAGINAFFVLVWIWNLMQDFDDDNWFNDQRKRLKRGFKALRRRLTTVRLPRPLPSPT